MINVAVIGAGHVGYHHARIFASNPRVHLGAIADIDTGKTDYAKQFNTRFFQNYKEIPDTIHAVSIATPTSTHAPIAEYFLLQNKHVFVEKAFTDDLASANCLINIAARKNLILQVGLIEKFNPAFINFKKHLNHPKFIETHRVHPFIQRCLDVDVILDLMIHDLDLIGELFHYFPVKGKQKFDFNDIEIDAIGAPVLTSKIDIAHACLKFPSGCICNLNASRVSHRSMRKMRIFQPDGYYSLDFSEQSLTIARPEIIKNPDKPSIDISSIAPEKMELLPVELQAFIASIENYPIVEPFTSGRYAQQSLYLALKIKNIIESKAQ